MGLKTELDESIANLRLLADHLGQQIDHLEKKISEHFNAGPKVPSPAFKITQQLERQILGEN